MIIPLLIHSISIDDTCPYHHKEYTSDRKVLNGLSICLFCITIPNSHIHHEERFNTVIMNSTNPALSTVVRFIAQNVTEHLQEDEIEYFLHAYEVGAVIICMILA